MGKYVENNLSKDEKIINKAKVSGLAIIPRLILFAYNLIFFIVILSGPTKDATIFFSVLITLSLLILIIRIAFLSSLELAITNKRIIGKKGVLRTITLDARLEKVDSIRVKQYLLGKIFKYSTKCIVTDSSKIKFRFIKNAEKFRVLVTEEIDRVHAEIEKRASEEQAKIIAQAIASAKASQDSL